MLTNPKMPIRAAAAPLVERFFTVNLYRNKIYVYQNVKVGKSSPLTLSKKVANFPQDQHHLDMVSQLYPNARIYGIPAIAA